MVKLIAKKHESMSPVIDEKHSELMIPKRACTTLLMDMVATDSEIQFKGASQRHALTWSHVVEAVKHEMVPMMGTAMAEVVEAEAITELSKVEAVIGAHHDRPADSVHQRLGEKGAPLPMGSDRRRKSGSFCRDERRVCCAQGVSVWTPPI